MFPRCLLLICCCLGFHHAPASSHADDRPNIVLILADDFGVGDIQIHYPNNKIATPYLDQLVREGISFSDAHSPSAVCSPTRYGMLTGRYAWRTRLQEWVIASYEPPLINTDRLTLPGFLRNQGYWTTCIGKWHLGWSWPGPQPSRMTEKRNGQARLTWDFERPILGGPTQRGFNYYFGPGLPNQPPFTYLENTRVVTQPTEPFAFDASEGIVLPNSFVGCPSAPGYKMQEVVPELTRRAVAEIHSCAKREQPFFLFYSMTSPHEPVVPSDAFRGKSDIAPVADFVMETDWSAGQVLKAVDDAGIRDNTIVIFTADNGHSHYTGWNTLIEAEHLPSGPYRGHKGDIWEGGHRVPLIVRWPNRCRANTTSSQLICLTDLFATCADVLKVDLPRDSAEDSLSFLSSALGAGNSPRSSLVSHSNVGEFAYRSGPWKLVFRMSQPKLERARGKPTVAELYNLVTDVSESNNLAGEHIEIVDSMTNDLRQLIEEGSTRSNIQAANDAKVYFEVTQPQRWTP